MMKKTKYLFPAFSFYDRTGIQSFLEKQAAEGWLLEKVGLIWRFRRIAPRRIRFAVTYFPKASAFDPAPSEQQEMFREFCAHSGWVPVTGSTLLQIFYNENENPVPIETDPLIELENIHKAAKKSFLPTYFMMLPVALMMWILVYTQYRSSPLNLVSNNIYYFNALCGVVLLMMCAVELIGYFRWYHKAKQAAVENGEFVATKGRRIFQIILITIEMIALAFLVVSFADARMTVMMICILILVGAVILITLGATALMKRMKVSAVTNRFVTIFLTAVLAFGAAGFGVAAIAIGINEWWPDHSVTYEYKGHTMNVYRDELPLTIEALMETDYDGYSYRWSRKQESIFVGMYEAYQRPRMDALGEPELSYTIVDVKADFLYDFCLAALTEGSDTSYSVDMKGNIIYDEYKPVNALPWCANEAYQQFRGEYSYRTWILCYDDCILVLEPDWEMTAEQMETVGQIFG